MYSEYSARPTDYMDVESIIHLHFLQICIDIHAKHPFQHDSFSYSDNIREKKRFLKG
jgi:hypothetical protein